MRFIVPSTLSLLALGNVSVAVANLQEITAGNLPASTHLNHPYTLSNVDIPPFGTDLDPVAGPTGDGKWFP